jgi:hypothetical protein
MVAAKLATMRHVHPAENPSIEGISQAAAETRVDTVPSLTRTQAAETIAEAAVVRRAPLRCAARVFSSWSSRLSAVRSPSAPPR